LIDLKEIENAKHVAIIVDDEALIPVASALYTYILRLHKKVSFICEKVVIDRKFFFLPWIDKVRTHIPTSSDLKVKIDNSDLKLHTIFKTNGVVLNQKMATALYASLLLEYDGFINSDADGTIFAMASELMACGADYKECHKFIIRRTTLARLRLKSLMLKNMVLQNAAQEAVFYLSDNDLKSSGASLEDAREIMKEALGLEYVSKISLIVTDQDKEI